MTRTSSPSAQSSSGAAGTVLLDWGSGGRLVDLPDGGHDVRPVSSAEAATAAADATLRGDALCLDLYLWGRLEALPTVMRGDLDVVEVSGSAPVLRAARGPAWPRRRSSHRRSLGITQARAVLCRSLA